VSGFCNGLGTLCTDAQTMACVADCSECP
jgi:hypothetical protein